MADNEKIIIKCPACGCEMEKVFMPEAGVNLDVCVNGCGGIYFDNSEFKKFDEPHEDISPLEKVFENKTFKEVDTTVTRYCPVCGSTMIKNYSSVSKEVEIDECYCCGGKFLDHGELEKIRAQYNTEQERADDVIKNLYSNVGYELFESKKQYEKLNNKTSFLGIFSRKSPSVLTKLIRIRNK